MKRWGVSKTVFPLISLIFLLHVGLAMTGCATTPLITAAGNGQTNVVKDLLNKGADVNETGSCGLAGWSVTPLYCAAYVGHMEAVKVLVGSGVDANARSHGFTPLAIASCQGHANIAKLLIDKGADVNAPGPDGSTPLSFAVSMSRANIAKLLIERGADIEYAMAKLKRSRDKEGYELLERLANKYQPPRYGASPPMLPTALPLPTESAKPF